MYRCITLFYNVQQCFTPKFGVPDCTFSHYFIMFSNGCTTFCLQNVLALHNVKYWTLVQ